MSGRFCEIVPTSLPLLVAAEPEARLMACGRLPAASAPHTTRSGRSSAPSIPPRHHPAILLTSRRLRGRGGREGTNFHKATDGVAQLSHSVRRPGIDHR